MDLYQYVDNQYINKPAPSLLPYLKQENESFRLRTVGVIIQPSTTYIFFPKNTNLSTIDLKKDLPKLIEVLNTYKTSIKNNATDILGSIETSNLYNVINWIIKDFKSDGLISFEEKSQRVQESGKINWNKSIKHADVIFQNNQPYLINLFKTKKTQKSNILTEIQSTILEKISIDYGYLFSNFQFRSSKKTKLSDSEMITHLEEISIQSHNIREKELIIHLTSFLKLLKSGSTASITTEDFHVLWETMVSFVFNDQPNLHEHIAQATWQLNIDGETYTSKNKQIPDTIVKNDDKSIDIFDAKYYDLSSIYSKNRNVSAPLDWYSVVKQFFYNFSFKYSYQTLSGCNDEKLNKGRNTFIFPAYRHNHSSTDNLVDEIGKVTIDLEQYGKQEIFVSTIPTFSLIDLYLRHEKIPNIKNNK